MLRTSSAYPFAQWPRVDRHDQRLLQRLSSALPADWDRTLEEASRILGATVTLREGVLELWPVQQARDAIEAPAAATVLSWEHGARSTTVVCELATDLAALLVDRVLGGDGERVSPCGRELDELSAGVASYFAARLCAAGGSALRVRDTWTDAERTRRQLTGTRTGVWSLAVELGQRPLGRLRVFIAEPENCQAGPSALAPLAAYPAFLRSLPIPLCLHSAQLSLPQHVVRSLALGDVVVPERSSLGWATDGLVGHATLHAVGARSGPFRCALRGAQWVLETPIPSLEFPVSETHRIAPPSANPTLASLPADAPIELCVELARFTMRLDELSALRPGQVLGTGQAIGQSVNLVAAGRAIARGELVDLEGEVGLRILELAP